MPRWNFGSTCHYSVTESGFVDVRRALLALPELVMETYINTRAPQIHTASWSWGQRNSQDWGKRGSTVWVGWDAGCLWEALLEWNLVAQT